MMTTHQFKLLTDYLAYQPIWQLRPRECDPCQLKCGNYGLVAWLDAGTIGPGSNMVPYFCYEHARELGLVW